MPNRDCGSDVLETFDDLVSGDFQLNTNTFYQN